MENDEYIQSLIIRYIENSCNDSQMQELLDWIRSNPKNREQFFGIKDIYDRSIYSVSLTDEQIAAGWQRLSEECGIAEPLPDELAPLRRKENLRSGRGRRILLGFSSIAAMLAIALATLYFSGSFRTEEYMEYYTSADSVRTVVLPDGSSMKMNAMTTVIFRPGFSRNERVVYLVGEALFEVANDPARPFIVRTASMSVTALGTCFNINAYPGSKYITASLIRGKVDVSNDADHTSFILDPGQQVVYDISAAESAIEPADSSTVTAWIEGKMIFSGASMAEIFTFLERKYNVEFLYNCDLFGDDKFNIKLNADTTLDEVLSTLSFIAGSFQYSIQGNQCRILHR